jgi:hypothetical protein
MPTCLSMLTALEERLLAGFYLSQTPSIGVSPRRNSILLNAVDPSKPAASLRPPATGHRSEPEIDTLAMKARTVALNSSGRCSGAK